MAVKRYSTEYPGVRYREHPERRHGVKRDRYYSIYYRLDGKVVEEGMGWASQGMTASKAALELGRLKEAQRLGRGAQTLQEKRAAEKQRREEDKIAKAEDTRDSLTFSSVFRDYYYPHAGVSKAETSAGREEQLFRLWAEPVIGHMTLKQIASSDLSLQAVRKRMIEGKRANDQLKANKRTEKQKTKEEPASPRSIHYCMAMIRQVFNYARSSGLYVGENPVKGIKERKTDNKRVRFLTHQEAEQLLDALRARSIDIHDMALLSLDCGLRASEILKLTWGDVDTDKGMMVLRDTKSGKTRFAYMTGRVKEMLTARGPDARDKLVFPGRNGKVSLRINNVFETTVKQLGLNVGVTDGRQKVVFHTLRHTYASWLVQNGVNLYTVQKLLGHSTISQTERYSHLAPSTLQDAVKVLERSIETAKQNDARKET